MKYGILIYSSPSSFVDSRRSRPRHGVICVVGWTIDCSPSLSISNRTILSRPPCRPQQIAKPMFGFLSRLDEFGAKRVPFNAAIVSNSTNN